MPGTPVTTRTLLSDLRSLLAGEPAVTAWAAAGGAVMLAAYAAGATAARQAAATTIITAMAAAYTAVRARPVSVSVVTGALVTAVTAAGAFGLNLSPHVIATGSAALSALLALHFRACLTPVATIMAARAAAHPARKGK
jgi:hypothetical protein